MNSNQRYYPEDTMKKAVESYKNSIQMSIRDKQIDKLIGNTEINNLITNTILKIKNKYDSNSKR